MADDLYLPPPEHSAPAMGYILWQLQRGESADAAVASMLAKPQYGGMSDSEIDAVRQEAQTNYDATLRLQAGDTSSTLDDALLRFGGGPTVVGLRVLLTGTAPDGSQRTASVTVNARSDMTVAAVQDAAVQFASDIAPHVWRRGSDALTEVTATIVQVITRGFSRPGMTV